MKRLTLALSALLSLLLIAAPVQAHEAGKWVLRGGIGTVAPDSKNLDLGDGVFVEVDDGTSLVLSGTYMFSQNWAFDILAAYPFSHDIDVAGDKAASTDHLPPTFSIQYHLVPDGNFQPYIGVGLNYTMFFSTDTTGPLDGTNLDLDDSFGFGWQACGGGVVMKVKRERYKTHKDLPKPMRNSMVETSGPSRSIRWSTASVSATGSDT